MTPPKKRVVALISGGGSNLQALIDACAAPDFPAEIVGVLSNKPEAFGLTRAEKAGIPTAVIRHTDFDGREAFDTALHAAIESFDAELVCLAGFMRILTAEFTQKWAGRMLNIHPSLLPKYKGLHTHQRALDAGDAEAGCTVHLVTPELDSGAIVEQATVPILEGDTASTLAARVLSQEHIIYPRALKRLALGEA